MIPSTNSSTKKLSSKEKKIIELLADSYNLFITLPDKHISDDVEFSKYIHILQRHVMSRLTRRIHPEIFGKK